MNYFGETKITYLAFPEMSAAVGLHCNNAPLHLAEKFQNLRPLQLLAQNRSVCAVGSMHLEYILRQIEPDGDNLPHDRSLLWNVADRPSHVNAIERRIHHQSP